MGSVMATGEKPDVTQVVLARPGITVVVPTYNEAANLPRLLARLVGALCATGRPFEVIVVDDGSPDGSAAIVDAFAKSTDARFSVLVRTGWRSLSTAVLAGARAARFDCVAVLDADLSHDPAMLPALCAPVLAGSADVVVGSRYLAGGSISGWTLRRRVTSWLGTAIARRLVPLRDPLSGFFAARRTVFQSAAHALRPRGYKILLELLGRADSVLRVHELPIAFRNRSSGSSKFGARNAASFAIQCTSLLAVRLRSSFTRSDSVDVRRILSITSDLKPT